MSGKNAVPRLLFLLLAVLILLLPACQRNSPGDIIREEASSYRFSLAGWHLQNLPVKLASTLSQATAIPPPEERKALLSDFFELQSEMAHEAALIGNSPETEPLKELGQEKRIRHEASARQIEAIIEQEITLALAAEGIGLRLAGWYFPFPPVLFSFQPPPNLVVVSPRDRIERLADRLLSSQMTVSDFELVENRLARYDNLSAIVVRLGGLASYPSIVDDGSGFYHSIFLAAHEWTHQYLFFYPLGRAYFGDGISREMNETAADMVGYEVADRIYRRYGYQPPPHQPPPAATGFDFTAEMHQTRLVTDRLLEEGKIDEAEYYMEERRQFLVQAGYHIRKLNQAYFAFKGTYALDPASVSPVGEQLEELRRYFTTLGEFVLAVRELSTQEQLRALLDEKRTSLIDSGG